MISNRGCNNCNPSTGNSNARSCKLPNYVVVGIINESDTLTRLSLDYYQTNNSIFFEMASYLNDYYDETEDEGGPFLGAIFVVPRIPPDRPRSDESDLLIERLQSFIENLNEFLKRKFRLLVIDDPFSDMSQSIINEIETLRVPINQENEDDLYEIDYIVNYIDNSGSFSIGFITQTDSGFGEGNFVNSFTNYYNNYSSTEEIDLFQQKVNEYSGGDLGLFLTDYWGQGFIGSNEEVYKYGFARGFSSKHIIVASDEDVMEHIIDFAIYIKTHYRHPNRNKNCEKLCKYRFTKFDGLGLYSHFPILTSSYASGDNAWDGILNDIYQDLPDNEDLYQYAFTLNPRDSFLVKFDHPASAPVGFYSTPYWNQVKVEAPLSPVSEYWFDKDIPGFVAVTQGIKPLIDQRTFPIMKCGCQYYEPVKNYYNIINRNRDTF
jgi:hypothetical protein